MDHYRDYDAEETSPGVFRHRHPHTHPTKPYAHQGLLASWYTPDQGHPHSHFPARPDIEQHHAAADIVHQAQRDHDSPNPADCP